MTTELFPGEFTGQSEMDGTELLRKVTVADLDKLVQEMADKRAEIELADRRLKDLNIEMGGLKGRAAAYLKELGREDYITSVGKVEVKTKERVNLPESIPDKLEFFAYLKEKGVFENYATVNSQSLNAYYFRERAEYLKAGGDPMTFSLPGVPAPKSFAEVDFKESKDHKAKRLTQEAIDKHQRSEA